MSNKLQQYEHDRIKKVVARQLAWSEEDIKPESTLVDDLGADSLDIVELTMGLEDEFDIRISDDDSEKWVTVQDILNYFDNL